MSRAAPRAPDTGPATLDSGALVTSSSCDTFLGPTCPGSRDQYLASTCQTQVRLDEEKREKRIHFQVILAPLDNDLSILKSKKMFLFVQWNIWDCQHLWYILSVPARPIQVTDGCKTFQTWLVYKLSELDDFWLVNNLITGLLLAAENEAGISRNSNPIIVKVSINIYSDQARDGLGTLSRNHHGHPPPYNILPLGIFVRTGHR